MGIYLIVPLAWIAAAIGFGSFSHVIELVGMLMALCVLPLFIDHWLWGKKPADHRKGDTTCCKPRRRGWRA